MIVKPKFFDSFKCVAGACTDTCCAGWEIDVDDCSLDFYNSLEGEDGEYVRERLIKGDTVKLCLEGERCRFLRSDNLCEMIIRLGENSLCDICREHPRFYSESENITEVGVGLCCPEATRRWLEAPCEFEFEDDGYTPDYEEQLLLSRQLEVVEFLLHGEGTLGERLALLLGDTGADKAQYIRLRNLYSSLEALDPCFSDRFAMDKPKTSEKEFARLASYFVYRYWLLLGERLCLKFCAASIVMIAAMGGDISEAAKDFSKEVEYDTDNLERIYSLLKDCDSLGNLCRDVFI